MVRLTISNYCLKCVKFENKMRSKSFKFEWSKILVKESVIYCRQDYNFALFRSRYVDFSVFVVAFLSEASLFKDSF